MPDPQPRIFIEGITISEFVDLIAENQNRTLKELKAYIDAEIRLLQSGNPTESSRGSKIYTEEELAELLGRSRQTLCKYRREGKLKNIKGMEPRIRYTQEAVSELLGLVNPRNPN